MSQSVLFKANFETQVLQKLRSGTHGEKFPLKASELQNYTASFCYVFNQLYNNQYISHEKIHETG